MRFVVPFAIAVVCLTGAGSRAGRADEDPRVELTPRPSASPKNGRAHAIQIDVRLILVPVTVTDTLGAPFAGLPREAFRLLEDGVEQEIKYFSSDDAPVSLGVVFDASRSMTGKLEHSRAAVGRFFRTAMPQDEFSLIEFNSAPRILSKFTTDTRGIEKTLAGIEPQNWTALYDAVYLGIQQMKHARNPRKALLLLSDGGDNYSRYTEPEMKRIVRESDVCIYSIGLGGGGLMKRNERVLRHLSEETGGRFYEVEKVGDLPDAVTKISAAIRHQYVLGFSSKNPRNNGIYRRIEVRLNTGPDVPRLRTSWRTGYYAPVQP